MRERRPKPPSFRLRRTLLETAPVATIDVRGLSASEAGKEVDLFIVTHHGKHPGAVVHIVIGDQPVPRGAPPVSGAIRWLLTGRLVGLVDEWARDITRGRYVVRLR